jgi:inosine-uridine nucleoside N-ribohydrolase
MRKKVLIDCDVGVDDALALILACHSPELEVKAVTGVNGNVPLGQVFENIQGVLSLIKPPHPPSIAKGADRPLKGNPVNASSVHGDGGLGGAKIERRRGEKWWKFYPGRADKLITESARHYPGELTLIALGPLTNLALALKRDRHGMQLLRQVVIMGGAVRTKGNITPCAEFNIFADPLAAKMVFESGLPILLVPLDVTHQVRLTPVIIENRVNPIQNSFSQFLIEATGYDFTTRQFGGRLKVFYLHDPLAVGAVIDERLVKKESLVLAVETQAGKRYGKTSEISRKEDQGGRDSPEQKIDVGLGVRGEKFLKLFLSRLEG